MRGEFAERVDLQIVRYAQVWEDHQVLQAALEVGHDDDVLSIGSAGCNVLALLAQAPRSLTAVDVSPAQLALLQLKRVAIERLPHSDFLLLLGSDADGSQSAQRAALYQELRRELPEETRSFWDAHPAELAEGLMHCGRLERYVQGFQVELSRIHRPEVIAQLFDFREVGAQGEYFRRQVGTPAFCDLYRRYFGRQGVATGGRDPSQYRYVTADPGVEGLRWLFSFCDRVLLHGNPYMIYWLRGRAHIAEVLAAHTLPQYSPQSYLALRPLLPRLCLVLDGVQQHLAQAASGRFSKANLSNVFEYMSDEEAGALFATLAERLRPGGRFAYFNLLVPRSAAGRGIPRLRSLEQQAAALHRRDRLYLYSAFHLEETSS